ncbi:MAG: adenosine deaminase [Candidatus Eisenbacteria bacterium]|nr:adenosine deaminase [Candidatus Eisenbacteria bacterium]
MGNRTTEEKREFLRSLRPPDLHRHFDGSVRPKTLWDLSQKYYSAIPGLGYEAFRGKLTYDPETDRDLLDYLGKFDIPLQYTQFYDNIQTIAEQIGRDAYAEGIRTLEVRINPIIHQRAGLTSRQVLSAVRKGLREVMRAHEDFRAGVVAIAMRNHGGNMAKILLRSLTGEIDRFHRDLGVVAFDIAGAEKPFPPILFVEPYRLAEQMGLRKTVHVGEDEGVERVWEAVDLLAPQRIGHAVSAAADPRLLKRLADEKIAVEVCLTSNLQTGAVERLEDHPLPRFLEAGIRCALCTDNPTVSRTDILREYAVAQDTFGFSDDDMARLARMAEEATFIVPLPRGE